jgi:tRNA threonylcarbamoyladenosine biosynthesis protein TsaB
MKILALEFSSPQRSVAVVDGNEPGPSKGEERTLAQGHDVPLLGRVGGGCAEIIETASGNTTKPFGMIEEALRRAGLEREQIECLAVGLGPGSYNGIRIAIALAQGWQLASRADGLKILGVSSAECIAAQAQADGLVGNVSVVIDAQRGEFYLANYELGAGGWREVSPLRLMTSDELREREQTGTTLVGPEVKRWFPNGRVVFPRAEMLGKLALGRNEFVSGDKLEPIYLRQTSFAKAPPPRTF